MYTKSKLDKLLIIAVILVCILTSCNLEIAKTLRDSLTGFGLIDLKENEFVLLASDAEKFSLSTELKGNYTYKWYSCTKDMESPVLVSTDAKPELNWDGGIGVKYYYCIVKNSSGVSKKTRLFTVAKTGLAVARITTDDGYPVTSKEEEKTGTISIFKGATGKITNNWIDLTLEEISLRGNTTSVLEKSPYNIKIKGKTAFLEYTPFSAASENISVDPEKKYDPFSSKKWVLLANSFDRSLIRNYASSEIASMLANIDEFSDWTPQMKFVDLYLNGQYRGQYVLAEKNRLEKKSRFAIKSIEDEYNHGDGKEKNYGFLVEIDYRADAKYHFNSQYTDIIYTLCDPDLEGVNPKDITATDEEAIVNYINNKIYKFEETLFEGNWEDLEKMIDIDSFVNWILINEFFKSVDAGKTSTYLWYEPTSKKIHFGPIWDFDLSSGNGAYSSSEGATIINQPFFAQLLSFSQFKDAIIKKWKKTGGCGEIITTFIGAMDTQIYDKIKLSAEFNFLKFKVLGLPEENRIYNEFVRDTYEKEYKFLKNWMIERLEWMDKLVANL